MELRFTMNDCTFGRLLLASFGLGLAAVLLGDDDPSLLSELKAKFPKASLIADDASLRLMLSKVLAFVETPAPFSSLDLKLDIHGTPFQARVWSALTAIPLGETRTYSDIAQSIGAPKSVRAVASACAANKLAIVIPCHRVLAKNGDLAGYRWGLDRKRRLLEREKALKS